ncbi:zinc finger protein 271 [Drosophila biarmipes]|uniref:zinc finger protein 271 n=1 Tax=Drosophila biarmipes TaxID=125945 RepID=UPI0007E884EA|nr:zinc finger protein 271 [Drosophila biarmipes]
MSSKKRKERCRVCLKEFYNAINIFDNRPDVLDAIAHYSGQEVSRGDSFPEFVCRLCLADAIAFQAKEPLEESNPAEGVVYEICEFLDKDEVPEQNSAEEFFEIVEYPDENEELEDGECIVQDTEVEESAAYEGDEADLDCTEPSHKRRKDLPIENEVFQESTSYGDSPNEYDLCEDEVGTEPNGQPQATLEPPSFSPRQAPLSDGSTQEKGELIRCPDCPKTFKRQLHFLKHSAIHARSYTAPKFFRCSFCLKFFQQQSELELHKIGHSGEKFRCNKCSKSFTSENDFKHHRQIFHFPDSRNDEPFKCPHCPKTYKTWGHFQNHRKGHGIAEEVLQVASDDIDSSNCIVINEPIEDDLFEDQVDTEPNEPSQTPKELAATSYTGGSTFQCNDCPMSFDEWRCFKIHRAVHRSPRSLQTCFRCSVCLQTFRRRADLELHMEDHNGQLVASNDIDSSNCQVVNEPIDNDLIEDQGGTDPNEESQTSWTFQCIDCPKSFNSWRSFNRHRAVHKRPRTEPSYYRCSVCLETYKKKADLDLHMEKHTGKLHKCSVCSESFTFENDLMRHNRKQHHLNPFKCPLCPLSYVLKTNFESHLVSHGVT